MFLISRNAMHFNSSGTIFFRQVCSIYAICWSNFIFNIPWILIYSLLQYQTLDMFYRLVLSVNYRRRFFMFLKLILKTLHRNSRGQDEDLVGGLRVNSRIWISKHALNFLKLLDPVVGPLMIPQRARWVLQVVCQFSREISEVA